MCICVCVGAKRLQKPCSYIATSFNSLMTRKPHCGFTSYNKNLTLKLKSLHEMRNTEFSLPTSFIAGL